MKSNLRKAFWTTALLSLGVIASPAAGQTTDSAENNNGVTEEIVVTGIRSSLINALVEKRAADNIKEIIQAEDIGKLPDQNLAEVLENITGVQIDRTAGVGTAVQIRGTGANRIEVNGVSTVGSGSGRSGISFDDLPAALIASVEVTKVPTAKTVEGSVGGTINLRTLRPLQLTEQIIAFRAQSENSDLSDSNKPRISGTYGNNWTNSAGQDLGLVVSASYARQDVTAFNPRFDRDREVLPGSGRASEEAFPFLRTQFFDQQHRNYDYETLNFTSSFEFEPNENLKLFVDATYNDQERVEKSNRVQISGTGGNSVVDATTNTSFETVNLGTIDGPNGPLVLGNVEAVLTGVLGVGGVEGSGGIDPNFRSGTNTGSRVTDSLVLSSGAEWTRDRMTFSTELSRSTSDTFSPQQNVILDFINPNGPQPTVGNSADNGVPVIFDARGRTLQFGIAPGNVNTPSKAELLDPANYRLRQLQATASTHDNTETAWRLDFSYDLADMWGGFTSVDAGIRWNQNESTNNDVVRNTNLTSASSPTFYRPTGDLFASLLIPGVDNFNDADGRTLWFPDYLVVDPNISFNDPTLILNTLNDAVTASNALNGVNIPPLTAPADVLDSFFDIEEETAAFYVQGNFETEAFGWPVRGNIGVRYVDTELTSVGNNVINGVVDSKNNQKGSYDFWLPRFNLVAEPMENLLIRLGAARDLRRPDFDDLSTSLTFPTSAGAAVNAGNPQLQPETVWSFDLSAEYYLSESSLFSIGFFRKERTNLFASVVDNPEETTGAGGQIERDITPPCEGGGIYNPQADRNVFSSTQGQGICVALSSRFNVAGTKTQTGVELGFQYDLSPFEDRLGWASGFGFIGNYTIQEEGGNVNEYWNGAGDGNALNDVLGRTDSTGATATLDDDVVLRRIELFSLSEDSYNATIFYDKYGVSFRARYTWRSHFLTAADAAGRFISFDLPNVVDDRAQLNASLSYQINDSFAVGVEGINLLREDRSEWCVNDNALLCLQGLTDRRITIGVSAQF